MSDFESSKEILSGDAASLGAMIQMMRGVVASGKISADQLALLKTNLPKILDHLKEASKSDTQALKDYLEFLAENRQINADVITQRFDLISELLDKEEDPEQRKMLYGILEELFDEEKLDREHARSEGMRSEKESRSFRENAVRTAIMVFSAAVVVAGVGTAAVLTSKKT